MHEIKAPAFIPSKAKFMIRDCKMVAEKNKINFKFNSYFPIKSLNLMRGVFVAAEDGIKSAFTQLREHWDQLDFAVHAIGFSDKSELKGAYYNTSRDNFEQTMLVSAFSFTELAAEARHMMPQTGGALLTLSYLGGVRTTPNYNVMGVAKAALEASTRYLAVDLGRSNIRVNTLSAGPMRTLAGSAITGARHIFRHSEEQAPLKRNPDIQEVGRAAAYLLSDLASGVTGETHYVDGGYHHIGVPAEITDS